MERFNKKADRPWEATWTVPFAYHKRRVLSCAQHEKREDLGFTTTLSTQSTPPSRFPTSNCGNCSGGCGNANCSISWNTRDELAPNTLVVDERTDETELSWEGCPQGGNAQEDIAEAVCERKWDGQMFGANGMVGTAGKKASGEMVFPKKKDE